MKFFWSFSLILLAALQLHAQSRASVSALLQSYIDSGYSKTDPLEEARNQVDVVLENDQDDFRTWLLKNKICFHLASNQATAGEYPNAAINSHNALIKALDAAEKSVEEKGKPLSKLPAKSEFRGLFEKDVVTLFNAGVLQYNAQKYDEALQLFEGILEVFKRTPPHVAERKKLELSNNFPKAENSPYRLALLAAVYAQDIEAMERLLPAVVEGNKQPDYLAYAFPDWADAPIFKDDIRPTLLSNAVDVYRAKNQAKKADELLAKARAEYPENQSLLLSYINAALREGRLGELEGELKQAVEADPDNAELLFVMGNMYDGLFRDAFKEGDEEAGVSHFDKAVKWYKKAIEANKEHFNSLYSLGAIYVNYSNIYADKANGLKTDDPKYKEYSKRYTELLKQAIPFLEQAETIKSDDRGLLTAFKEIYARLEMEDKFMEYNKRLKALN